MERFIARENIRRFKAQLVLCTDERQRETLKGLLAAQKRILQELDSRRTARNRHQAVEIEKRQFALRQSISEEMLARHHRELEQNDN